MRVAARLLDDYPARRRGTGLSMPAPAALRLIRPEDPSTTDRAGWSSRLAGLPIRTVPPGPIVVVAPHPDDETLGAGGLISWAARHGRDVVVVVCTDGEAAFPSVDIGRIRRAEFDEAIAVLTGGRGARVERLCLSDGDLTSHATAMCDSLEPLVDEHTLVVGPWPGDGHPDHDAVAAACDRVAEGVGARTWRYPIWAWHWSTPEDLLGGSSFRVLLGPEDRHAKQRALDAYRSQRDGRLGPPVVSAALLGHFDHPFETFIGPL